MEPSSVAVFILVGIFAIGFIYMNFIFEYKAKKEEKQKEKEQEKR